ncbi:MAG TPA: exosortase/archaeosortase family protein [Candidatus Paceibacterota bacterium]|nr:exosortase/archaeosortase family protein [Candidatus Paceibacterota bacterium]
MDNQTAASAATTSPPQAQAVSNIGVLDEFQTELISAWKRLPNKAFFFILLVAWLALFQFAGNSIFGYVKTSSLFSWMYEAYTSPNPVAENDRHGTFIPFIVVGLFWMKRNELLALPNRVWSPGLALVVCAMVLHAIGFVVQQPHLSIVAMFIGIYGLMGLAWGWQWMRKSVFPFFLFIFCVPLANRADLITFPLRLLVCWLVEVICHNLLGIDVIRAGTQLFDPSGHYQYEVAAACSGIRSLVAIFLMSTAYGFLVFRSAWKRLLMMAMAFPFAVIGNLLRMLCIIIAAQIGGQKWGDYVHEGGPMGIISMLPYIPAIFGVLYLGRFLENKKQTEVAK